MNKYKEAEDLVKYLIYLRKTEKNKFNVEKDFYTKSLQDLININIFELNKIGLNHFLDLVEVFDNSLFNYLVHKSYLNKFEQKTIKRIIHS